MAQNLSSSAGIYDIHCFSIRRPLYKKAATILGHRRVVGIFPRLDSLVGMVALPFCLVAQGQSYF